MIKGGLLLYRKLASHFNVLLTDDDIALLQLNI